MVGYICMPIHIIRLLSLGIYLTVLVTNRQLSPSAEEKEGREAEKKLDVE